MPAAKSKKETKHMPDLQGNTIIVIDPGHGGENLGAQFDGYTEKEMTLIVARAMKEELETYDNVVVYLTRESDQELSLEERAQFAKDRNADFLFCLHFNSSVNHNLYGSEVWVSAFGEYYSKGRSFAEINMRRFEDMGLFSRGIKTRLNSRGDNYYGILRNCTDLEVPAALIEHCHLDQARDKVFYQQSEEQLVTFGREDGKAVAEYFGLKSSKTGEDFSSHVNQTFPIKEINRPDQTEAEVCRIELLSIDPYGREADVKIMASDSDGYIQYYCYRFDEGEYSELYPWPREAWNSSLPEHEFTVALPEKETVDLQVCVYNGYDLKTESNTITVSVPLQEEDAAVTAGETETLSKIPLDLSLTDSEIQAEKGSLILLILCVSLIVTGIFYFVIRLLQKRKRRNKGRRER